LLKKSVQQWGMPNARRNISISRAPKLFGLADWIGWLDSATRSMLGMSAEEFERSYMDGTIEHSGEVEDIASVLPLIRSLRMGSQVK
jgi:hypothetical protein